MNTVWSLIDDHVT